MAKYNKDFIELFHNHDIFVPDRAIYIGPNTTSLSAESFLKNLKILEKESSNPITIYMNNIGGDITEGKAIYDAIRHSSCHVTIVVNGYACSAGSIILQAADKRVMYENSKIMIHYGQLSVSDHPKIVKRWVEDSDKDDKFQEDLFYSKMKIKIGDITIKRIKEMLKFDTIFSAKEALEHNLIDEILLPKVLEQ